VGPPMSQERPHDQVAILEACRRVAAEYGWPTRDLKPCIACLLDGNIGGAGRHEAAFLIALETRRLEMAPERAERVLRRWARKAEYNPRLAERALKAAQRKRADGSWAYWPPGLVKKPGSLAGRVLLPYCEEAGCPQNCPPLAEVARGGAGGTLARYKALGWPAYLRQRRRAATDDIYQEIARLEGERGISAGGPIRTSFKQLAERNGRHYSSVGKHLDFLFEVGLLAVFERGSGSGPNARDRRGSLVRRNVPIPAPPPYYRNSSHRLREATSIGGLKQPDIDGRERPDIGGLGGSDAIKT
jgi:hypothetical protein